MKDVTAPEKAITEVTPFVLFSLSPISISPQSVDISLSLTFFFLSHLLPFPWLMKGFICHPAGDECNVFHPDLYSVSNEISAMLLHAPTTETETWVK